MAGYQGVIDVFYANNTCTVAEHVKITSSRWKLCKRLLHEDKSGWNAGLEDGGIRAGSPSPCPRGIYIFLECASVGISINL